MLVARDHQDVGCRGWRPVPEGHDGVVHEENGVRVDLEIALPDFPRGRGVARVRSHGRGRLEPLAVRHEARGLGCGLRAVQAAPGKTGARALDFV